MTPEEKAKALALARARLKLAQAKAPMPTQADVVTVETPDGPVQMAKGRRVLSPSDLSQRFDAADAAMKQRALEGALSFLSGSELTDEVAGLKAAAGTLPRLIKSRGKDAQDPRSAYYQAKEGAQRQVDSATKNASPTVSVMGAEIPVLPALGMMVAQGPVAEGFVPRLVAAGYGGALAGAGGSKAKALEGDVGGVARDAAIGAGAGVAGQALGEGAGKVVGAGLQKALPAAAAKLERWGIDNARRAIQGRSDIAAATRKPLSDAAVREVLSSGAMKAGQTTEQVAEGIASKLGSAGNDVQGALDKLAAEGAPGANLFQVRDELLAKAADAASRDAQKEAAYFLKMAKRAETMAAQRTAGGAGVNAAVGIPGDMSLADAEAIKRTWQQEAAGIGNSQYKALNPSAPAEAAAEAAAVLRRANEDAAGAYADLLNKPELAKEFNAAKGQYSKLAEANRFAQKAVAKEAQQKGSSVFQKITNTVKDATQNPLVKMGGAGAGAALASSSPEAVAVALGLAGLQHLASTRGGTTKAVSQMALADALRGVGPMSVAPAAGQAGKLTALEALLAELRQPSSGAF